mmetsp:Transcript_20635/g.29430  ORF Transcript_20635/g.29430 Transcript_20635/m.29430 type:complete len:551 (+) Transcript_20635:170-1822(+)
MMKIGIARRFNLKQPEAKKTNNKAEGESSVCMDYSSSECDSTTMTNENNYVYSFSCDESSYMPEEEEDEQQHSSSHTIRGSNDNPKLLNGSQEPSSRMPQKQQQGNLSSFSLYDDISVLAKICNSNCNATTSSMSLDRSTTSTNASPTTVTASIMDNNEDCYNFLPLRECDESIASFGNGSSSVTTKSDERNHHPNNKRMEQHKLVPVLESKKLLRMMSSGRELHQRAQRHLEEGQLDEALALFESILKTHRKQYGDYHKFVGAALHNVAIVHIRAKRHGKALVACQEAVMVRRKVLGNFHLDLAQSLVKLGCVQMSLKDYDSSMHSFQEALTIRRKSSCGKDDLKVAQIMSHIGLLYFEIGELLAAVSSFEEALSMYRSCTDEDQVVIADTLANIGALRSKRQQYSQAIVAYEEAMMLQTIHHGDGHSAVLGTMDSLAYAYSKYGSHENAIELYKQILKAQKAKLMQAHKTQIAGVEKERKDLTLDCAQTLHKMSIVYEKMNTLSSAIQCTRQVMEMQFFVYGTEDHATVIGTRKSLSRLLKKEKANPT